MNIGNIGWKAHELAWTLYEIEFALMWSHLTKGVSYVGQMWLIQSLFLLEHPMSKWYVVWCGSKNKYQKDTCLKEVKIYAKNLISKLDSIVSIIGGGPIRPFNEHENLYFENE